MFIGYNRIIEATKIVTNAVTGVVNDLNVVGTKRCINKPTINEPINIGTDRCFISSGRLTSNIPTIMAIIEANINADFI